MIKLTSEEWALLSTVPSFAKLIGNLREERARVADMMVDGELLDANDADRTALNYAVNVGRMQTLGEIVNYRPMEEDKDA